MSAPLIAPTLPWGDRIKLLPKKMLYALSLDLIVKANGPYLLIVNRQENAIRHMFDEAVVTMPEGLRCDVPTGTLESGDGEIGSASDPSSPSLRLRIGADIGSPSRLNIDATGVVNFNGGAGAFRSQEIDDLTGSAHIATSYETASATYRWLNRRQLFGVGRVTGWRNASRERWLAFSFDLYAAA